MERVFLIQSFLLYFQVGEENFLNAIESHKWKEYQKEKY